MTAVEAVEKCIAIVRDCGKRYSAAHKLFNEDFSTAAAHIEDALKPLLSQLLLEESRSKKVK